jgi:hypothetical protein
MMATNPLALMLVLSALVPQEDQVVVASVEPLAVELKESLRTSGRQEAQDKLRKEGFVEFRQGRKLYLVASDLAQADAIDFVPKFWQAMANPTVVDCRRRTAALSRFLQAAYGPRFGNAEGANYASSAAVAITLESNGRTLTFHREDAMTADLTDWLAEKPLQSRPPGSSQGKHEPLNQLTPREQHSIHLFTFGLPEFRQTAWAYDFQTVSQFLVGRQSAAQAAARRALEELYAQMPAGAFMQELAGLEASDAFAKLPPGLRASLELGVISQFKQYGFDDADAAEAFLQSARVQSFSKGLKITAARGPRSWVSVDVFP